MSVAAFRRAAILMFSLSIFSGTAKGQLEPGFCGEYVGSVNKDIEIGMSLETDGHELRGDYFYKRYLKDIPVKGEYVSERDIVLHEYTAEGEMKGTFKLRFVEQDPEGPRGPLKSEVMRGTWISSDGSESYPVFLSMEHGSPSSCEPRYAVAGATSDERVEKNVQGFYFSVLKGDKQKVADYVAFPLTFSLHKNSKTVYNRTAFLRYYDQIFTNKFVAAIANGIPHHMFANWQGIMIGNGVVWFDDEGKARHFNNQD